MKQGQIRLKPLSQVCNTVKDGFISTSDLVKIARTSGQNFVEEMRKRYPNQEEVRRLEKEMLENPELTETLKRAKETAKDDIELNATLYKQKQETEKAREKAREEKKELDNLAEELAREERIQQEIQKRSKKADKQD